MDQLLLELAKYGLPGLLLAIVGYYYDKKDKQLTTVYEKRVEDNNRLATVIEATNAASRALVDTHENSSRALNSLAEAVRVLSEQFKSQAALLEAIRAQTEQNGRSLEKPPTRARS